MQTPAFISILRSVLGRHRELVLELARREIAERYAGSALGAAWAVLTPLVTMAIYVGLFAFVFPVRFGGDASPWAGAALILSGLVPWLAFVDVATRAPSVFVAQRALVRQVVFPIEALPARAVASALVPWAVGTSVAFAVAAAAVGPKPTWLLVPALWALELLAMFGAACFLATLGAWMRDLREMVSILANVGLYAAPILLLPATIGSLPGVARVAIALNPFSHMTWCFHDAVVHGRIEHPVSWIAFPATAVVLLVAGGAVLSRARPNLAEAL